MDIADLLDTDRHDDLLGLRLKIEWKKTEDNHGTGERQTQYWLNNTDFVMLNKIEKAYKKSDVYLEVLSYLVILIAVGI